MKWIKAFKIVDEAEAIEKGIVTEEDLDKAWEADGVGRAEFDDMLPTNIMEHIEESDYAAGLDGEAVGYYLYRLQNGVRILSFDADPIDVLQYILVPDSFALPVEETVEEPPYPYEILDFRSEGIQAVREDSDSYSIWEYFKDPHISDTEGDFVTIVYKSEAMNEKLTHFFEEALWTGGEFPGHVPNPQRIFDEVAPGEMLDLAEDWGGGGEVFLKINWTSFKSPEECFDAVKAYHDDLIYKSTVSMSPDVIEEYYDPKNISNASIT